MKDKQSSNRESSQGDRSKDRDIRTDEKNRGGSSGGSGRSGQGGSGSGRGNQ